MKKMLHKLYDFWRLFSVSSENGDFRCGRNFGKSRQSAAVAAILQTLPLPKLIMIAVCVLCFIYLATIIDSCAYVLAGTTTKSIGRKEEPARWNRICWALIFCALSVGLMIIGGLQAIQSVSIIAALPLIGVMFLLILSVIKMLNEREE